jgi:hypothetical protein
VGVRNVFMAVAIHLQRLKEVFELTDETNALDVLATAERELDTQHTSGFRPVPKRASECVERVRRVQQCFDQFGLPNANDAFLNSLRDLKTHLGVPSCEEALKQMGYTDDTNATTAPPSLATTHTLTTDATSLQGAAPASAHSSAPASASSSSPAPSARRR